MRVSLRGAAQSLRQRKLAPGLGQAVLRWTGHHRAAIPSHYLAIPSQSPTTSPQSRWPCALTLDRRELLHYTVMRLSLQLPPPKSLHAVSLGHSEMLASAHDWEVVGAVTFNGRVDLLVFVERKTFWQIGVEVFEPSDFDVPPRWRLATRMEDRIPGVSSMLGHPLLLSNPDLVSALIDGDEDAIAKLRAALERDETIHPDTFDHGGGVS